LFKYFLNSALFSYNVWCGILSLEGFVNHWNPILGLIVLLRRSDMELDYRLFWSCIFLFVKLIVV